MLPTETLGSEGSSRRKDSKVSGDMVPFIGKPFRMSQKPCKVQAPRLWPTHAPSSKFPLTCAAPAG